MTGKPEIRRPDSGDQSALLKKMTGEICRPEIKTVSFRLDNTLVITPFDNPDDIFDFMEQDFALLTAGTKPFSQLRKAAEDTVRRSGKVTLEKIYRIIQKSGKLTDSGRDRMMKRECELKVYFSFPRRAGKIMYDEAVRQKKKTAVITDSIYPRSVIRNILDRCGYTSHKLLLLASETETDKEHDIIDAVMEKSSSAPGQLLHIGGSVEEDVEAAVLKGAKSMLLSPVNQLMVRSGRLRGYVEAQHVLDLDSPEYLALRCAFGLYAAYGFDIPQNKTPHSDFCSDLYLLGFIVLGALSLVPDFSPDTPLQKSVLEGLRSCKECNSGYFDFRESLDAHFSDFLDKFGGEDCELPFLFLVNHGAVGDRMSLERQIDPADSAEWSGFVTDPSIAPIHANRIKKNALSRFADKLFPPGSKVRNIVDGMLVKLHR